MVILYGNIFRVTRNRLPADVRFRRRDSCAAQSRRLEGARVTTGRRLMKLVRRQSPTTATTSPGQHQAINFDNSSASSDGRQSDMLSRQASRRNSECFEMTQMDQDEGRSDVRCPRESPPAASRPLRVGRLNSSMEYQSTAATRSSLTNFRFSSRKDEWRRTAGLTAGAVAARRENKAAKTLVIVVGGFVVCWLPFFILYVVEPFCASCPVNDALRSMLTWLGYANSLLNPFIYATYNKHFRHSFWHLTVGRFNSCLRITHRLNDVTETRVTL